MIKEMIFGVLIVTDSIIHNEIHNHQVINEVRYPNAMVHTFADLNLYLNIKCDLDRSQNTFYNRLY